jgi:hypothetical protein
MFEDARKTGLISAQDVDKTRLRGYVRQDISQPGHGTGGWTAAGRARRVAGRIYRKAVRVLGLNKHVG